MVGPEFAQQALDNSSRREGRGGVRGVQGDQEFRSSGVQEFRSSGVQEFRSCGGVSARFQVKTLMQDQVCLGAANYELLNSCNSLNS
jgi:hypothetical protein